MARSSPIRAWQDEQGAVWAEYGSGSGVVVAQAIGEPGLEYAAIRKGCAVLDLPQRGVIEVRGSDRLEFLDRMLTQAVRALEPYRVVHSFWLARTGRIVADLRLISLPELVVVDLDVLSVEATVASLGGFLFGEDVSLEDATERAHRLSVQGPASAEVLESAGVGFEPGRPGELASGQACQGEVCGARVVMARDDTAAVPGYELVVSSEAALDVYRALVSGSGERAARPAGWHAYNTARVEAGTPMFLLDFGQDSLPHESGVLRDRVSFAKGCYLGQEIVARMESRGKVRRRLVGLGPAGEGGASLPQPVTGSQVLAAGGSGPEAEVVGAVTSSVVSPMLGSVPVCFAVVRSAEAEAGTRLMVEAEGGEVAMEVQAGLRFWPRPA